MYSAKSKVGYLCICYVVVWLVLVYGNIWGQLKKSTPPPLFPLRRSERYCCSTSVRPQADGSFHFHWWRAPVPLRPSEGEEGGGCSFSAVPKFRRRPTPTIPLHSKFINDQLCFWHHTFSTNSSSTISSSILSTTRRGELYVFLFVTFYLRFHKKMITFSRRLVWAPVSDGIWSIFASVYLFVTFYPCPFPPLPSKWGLRCVLRLCIISSNESELTGNASRRPITSSKNGREGLTL